MRATGQSPYPVVVPRTDSIDVVRRRHGVILPSTSTGDVVSITGRVIALREHGRLVFAVVRESLVDMQIMIAEDVVGATAFAQWKEIVDLGDHVSCTGEVMTTRTGELSVAASSWMLASKCLHPFPRPNRSQLSDASRVRHRHLALLADPKELQALAARSKVLSTLRRVLDDEGFMEVETPMLHTVQGGAIARPFTTHSNAHDTDLYLRIAPELYLKRLCVGGLERVYELNRNFRNEGADRTHNPEFTALEVYQAHADYIDMQVLARQLVQACAVAVNGRAVAIVQPHGGAPESVDLAGPWAVVPVHRAVADAVGAPIDVDTDVDDLRTVCARHRIDVPFDATAGELVHSLYEHLVEPATRAPTFYTDFPVEVSPLARRHRDDPRLAERWDLVAFGMELGTAYSELTDPIDQRARLVRQARKASAGDPEAMQLDEDFLSALEFALPPTGGLGMGVDRLLMLVTGGNIRSTLAFPFVRPMRSSPLGDPGDGSFEGA
jgi:lysyl-tRNA synthetase class 2